jgi:hypothetical protein
VDSKKTEKFKNRAVALRRVSIVLSILALLMVPLGISLLRDGSGGALTLTNVNKTKLQHNYLSIFILILGSLLLVQSVFGFKTSKNILSSIEHEPSPSKLAQSSTFYIS